MKLDRRKGKAVSDAKQCWLLKPASIKAKNESNLLGSSMTTDQIHIKDLLLRTIVGVNEEEQTNKQDVLINIILYTDHSAASSDDIRDVVNYRTITKQTIQLVENAQFCLVERMALEIANLCLSDPRVERTIVTVEKPGALRFARSVGVTVDRTRA